MIDMLPTKKPTVLIMAGGTGGHIFPGLAVAEELISKGWSANWLGSKGGMEERLVDREDISLNLISIKGLRGNGLKGWLKAPFVLLSAVSQARQVIRKSAPDIVIGFGGFASGPGGLAAYLMNKTLFIHEQNAVAGLTNRMLSKISKRIFLAFPNALKMSEKCKTVGNPIRKEIKAIERKKVNTEEHSVNVLILGGSRGAQVFNHQLPSTLISMMNTQSINVWHQCGKGNSAETIEIYREENSELKTNDLSSGLLVSEFIEDMSKAYQWADVVICRAGALTVSEIAAVGIAAVFIPYPYAVDDHQTKNAQWLVENNAALLIAQNDLQNSSSEKLVNQLFTDVDRINRMADNARKMAYLNATEEIARACEYFFEAAA